MNFHEIFRRNPPKKSNNGKFEFEFSYNKFISNSPAIELKNFLPGFLEKFAFMISVQFLHMISWRKNYFEFFQIS